eukprot:SAG31_NODE_10353_length_1149_cov_2.310476_1_plen_127_part_00
MEIPKAEKYGNLLRPTETYIEKVGVLSPAGNYTDNSGLHTAKYRQRKTRTRRAAYREWYQIPAFAESGQPGPRRFRLLPAGDSSKLDRTDRPLRRILGCGVAARSIDPVPRAQETSSPPRYGILGF